MFQFSTNEEIPDSALLFKQKEIATKVEHFGEESEEELYEIEVRCKGIQDLIEIENPN